MNSSRRPLVAGNWKMNAGGAAGVQLAAELQASLEGSPELSRHVELMVAPPFTAIAAVAAELHGSPIGIAAQDVDEREAGAFTGQVSASMLQEAGATAVLVGHSERRRLFGDSDERVLAKTLAVQSRELLPIVCVGETLAQRQANETRAVLETQIRAIAPALQASKGALVIAYEPVWAIGTGHNATPAQAQEAHQWIRALLAREATNDLAQTTRVLYGGSVTPENAGSLFAGEDVDGALVGGASLKARSFLAIADAARLRVSQTRASH